MKVEVEEKWLLRLLQLVDAMASAQESETTNVIQGFHKVHSLRLWPGKSSMRELPSASASASSLSITHGHLDLSQDADFPFGLASEEKWKLDLESEKKDGDKNVAISNLRKGLLCSWPLEQAVVQIKEKATIMHHVQESRKLYVEIVHIAPIDLTVR